MSGMTFQSTELPSSAKFRFIIIVNFIKIFVAFSTLTSISIYYFLFQIFDMTAWHEFTYTE